MEQDVTVEDNHERKSYDAGDVVPVEERRDLVVVAAPLLVWAIVGGMVLVLALGVIMLGAAWLAR